TPLAHLFTLNSLSASNNLIEDISPLSGLTNLVFLNLAQNPVTNYPVFLTALHSLTNLVLSDDHITNVFFLTNLSRLTVLALDDNSIADASPLGELRQLSWLSLRGNYLTNADFLTNATQLTYLNLATNRIRDISALAGLPLLTTVSLQENLVTNLAPLSTASASSIGLEQNELDVSAGSPALTVINSLQNAGVSVSYAPQYPLDSDGDGMPDDWEIAHGLDPSDPADALLDPDSDNLSNLLEYALGTDPRDPTDADACLKVSFLNQGAAQLLVLAFLRRSGPVRIQYIPEVSADGVNWYADPAHIEAIGVAPFDDQFDWVTNEDPIPVSVSQPCLIRLRILRR
ncbi:MAG: leucine-rich repeat domain-containing protein, partial [Limisphaerales bacterium]